VRHRKISEISFEDFSQLTPVEKGAYCNNSNGMPYHTLVAQQFDRQILEKICKLATRIRRISKSKTGMKFLSDLLCHRRAMLYFSQPSSRTFLSFYAACQILGMKPSEVRDPSTSSEMKGESPEDTIRTFSSFFDLLIMRTPQCGFSEKMAWHLSNTERPVPIINAGSGMDQHPTQSLLDIYTLDRSFEKRGGIDNKNVVFVGDLKRGRTVRSLACLLSNYSNVKQYFVAPEQLQIGKDILEQLDSKHVKYEICYDFEATLPKADAIYMTRIQNEWDKKTNQNTSNEDANYQLRKEHLKLLKVNSIIMHPLPRRKEIANDIDSDPRAIYWRQVRNGMWARTSLIACTFGRDNEINTYYEQNLK